MKRIALICMILFLYYILLFTYREFIASDRFFNKHQTDCKYYSKDQAGCFTLEENLIFVLAMVLAPIVAFPSFRYISQTYDKFKKKK